MATELNAVPQSDHFRLALDPASVVTAYAAHRRRFASSVATLDERALRSPSRCSEWSVADVLRHGCDVDRWMRTIWAGELPFNAFDPRVTPHEEVVQGRSAPDAEVRDRYVVSAQEMATEVDGAGPERWGLPSVSYAGFVPWWQALLHVLFDSWVHERDALLPLGLPVDELDDEITAVLAYSLALVPYADRRFGGDEPLDAVVCGIRVTATPGPVVVVPVAAGESPSGALPTLTGDPPRVIDALSGRGNLDEVLTGDREVIQHLGFFARYLTTAA